MPHTVRPPSGCSSRAERSVQRAPNIGTAHRCGRAALLLPSLGMSFSDGGETMNGRRSFALVTAIALVGAMIALAAYASGGTGGTTGDASRATLKYHTLATAKSAGYGLLKDKNGVSCI